MYHLPVLGSSHQRARGAARLALRLREGRTVLSDLRQDGCLKIRFPGSRDGMEAVLLNSSGGVAGGDDLATSVSLGEGATATIASQAAERFYRALPDDPPAQIRNTVTLAAGAALDWLPQETILFDGCAMDRQLDVDMQNSARFLGVEALVFGRTAMGEIVTNGRVSDLIRIRRDGQLLLHDATRLHGPIASILARPAVAGAHKTVATLVYVAPDAPEKLDRVRAAVASVAAAEAGASAWNGMLVARILAPDGRSLRAAITAILGPLRDGKNLPRVWHC